MAEVHGSSDPRFEAMREILSANIDSGADVGASVAVMLDGEMVVDLWGGFADEARTTPWQADTITNVWSSTKTMTALSALMLHSRGQLDLDAPVAAVLARVRRQRQGGRARAPPDVAHLRRLRHGRSPSKSPTSTTGRRAPRCSPRRRRGGSPAPSSGYHALNQGHLVGEVVRRITGKKLGEFFRDAGGRAARRRLPHRPRRRASSVASRTSSRRRRCRSTSPRWTPSMVVVKTFTGPAPGAETSWTTEWRQADIGAANGTATPGRWRSCRAPSATAAWSTACSCCHQASIDQIFREQANGVDLVLMMPMRFGIGFGLPSETDAARRPTGASASGAAGAARWSSTTSTTA